MRREIPDPKLQNPRKCQASVLKSVALHYFGILTDWNLFGSPLANCFGVERSDLRQSVKISLPNAALPLRDPLDVQ